MAAQSGRGYVSQNQGVRGRRQSGGFLRYNGSAKNRPPRPPAIFATFHRWKVGPGRVGTLPSRGSCTQAQRSAAIPQSAAPTAPTSSQAPYPSPPAKGPAEVSVIALLVLSPEKRVALSRGSLTREPLGNGSLPIYRKKQATGGVIANQSICRVNMLLYRRGQCRIRIPSVLLERLQQRAAILY